jgi:hypothetical protein
MSAARPPRSIRVAAIRPPLRERSPAILPAGLRPSGHDRLRGRDRIGWPGTVRRQPNPPKSPFAKGGLHSARCSPPFGKGGPGGGRGGFAVARCSRRAIRARRTHLEAAQWRAARVPPPAPPPQFSAAPRPPRLCVAPFLHLIGSRRDPEQRAGGGVLRAVAGLIPLPRLPASPHRQVKPSVLLRAPRRTAARAAPAPARRSP